MKHVRLFNNTAMTPPEREALWENGRTSRVCVNGSSGPQAARFFRFSMFSLLPNVRQNPAMCHLEPLTSQQWANVNQGSIWSP